MVASKLFYILVFLLQSLRYVVLCVANIPIFIRLRFGHDTVFIVDYYDGIYADFYNNIVAELKRADKDIYFCYSKKLSISAQNELDYIRFIPQWYVQHLNNVVLICASIPNVQLKGKKSRIVQLFHGFASMGSGFGVEFIKDAHLIVATTNHLYHQILSLNDNELIAGKKIINGGYPKIDGTILPSPSNCDEIKSIFYGPTYHRDISSVFTFFDPLLDFCKEKRIKLFVKLHPLLFYSHNYEFSGGINWLKRTLQIVNDNPNVEFIPNSTPFESVRKYFEKADVFVTDTSGLGFEYCLITGRPIIFLGDKIKVPIKDLKSKDTEKYSMLPEIHYRGVLGPLISKAEDLPRILGTPTLSHYIPQIMEFRNTFSANLGASAKYISSEILILAQKMSMHR